MDLGLFQTLEKGAGVIVTIGLFSVLYKENKFFRFCEHLFLGLAAGWALVAIWTETLSSVWWDKMMGTIDETSKQGATAGLWIYAILLPIGFMSYTVFSKKHNWMSRIPLGIILGIWSGQQIQSYFDTYGPQVRAGMKPIFPTTGQFLVPAPDSGIDPSIVGAHVYISTAISNFLFMFTLVSVLSYFLFSFDVKNKAILKVNMMGRYLLMIGFGAIFGTTVMMRFTLVIDRMYFIWIEFFQKIILRQ
ncbi:MAG: hypothetical protein JST12_13230 [Armatimonadetes bacterium]|nr:hypothetical protein [Armatimonadota bacterium]MBS1702622.1 hypothetical protein [Armatimonadota bacterium]MBS1726052.1 hypothetical protein [Armatimonadota bacterium]